MVSPIIDCEVFNIKWQLQHEPDELFKRKGRREEADSALPRFSALIGNRQEPVLKCGLVILFSPFLNQYSHVYLWPAVFSKTRTK